MPQTPGDAVLTVIALAFGLFLGAGLVINMVGMLVNREIGWGEFLVWLLAFLGVLATTLKSVGSPLFPVLVLVTILLGLIVPLASWAVDRWGARRMRKEDLERFLLATQQRPDLPYNFRRLGDLFYESGDFQLAIEYYEQAEKLHHDIHQAFFLEKAHERLALGKGQPRLCISCGRMNPHLALNCIACGASLPGLHHLLAPLTRGHWRHVLVAEAALLIGAGLVLILLRHEELGMLSLLVGLGLAGLHFTALKSLQASTPLLTPPAAATAEPAGDSSKEGPSPLQGETPSSASRPELDGLEDMNDDR